jgi:hypothetical protein
MASSPDSPRFVVVPHRPHLRWWLIGAGLAWVLSLAGVAWWASHRAVPMLSAAETENRRLDLALDAANGELRTLRQQVATLRRSDQISRDANTELQATLAERDEELAGLRADVSFYERLVGATGQRQGLKAHEALFQPEAGGAWRYTVTLTQNLNRGTVTQGQMRLSIEGVNRGRLATLSWGDLLQRRDAPGQPFSFRYFQQLEGSVMLPAGFTPRRVRVQLRAGNSAVDETFPWTLQERPPAGEN